MVLQARGTCPKSKIAGTGGLKPTGLRPMFLHKFGKHGMELPANIFTAPPGGMADIARGQR